MEPRSPALQADSLPAEPQGRHPKSFISGLSFPAREGGQTLSHSALNKDTMDNFIPLLGGERTAPLSPSEIWGTSGNLHVQRSLAGYPVHWEGD